VRELSRCSPEPTAALLAPGARSQCCEMTEPRHRSAWARSPPRWLCSAFSLGASGLASGNGISEFGVSCQRRVPSVLVPNHSAGGSLLTVSRCYLVLKQTPPEKLPAEVFWWRQLVTHSAVNCLVIANRLFLIIPILSFFSDDDNKKRKKNRK